jgi:adenylate cyclase
MGILHDVANIPTAGARRETIWLLPAVIALVIAAIVIALPWFSLAEERIADRYLRLLPDEVPDEGPRNRIVIVSIDDRAIDTVGSWPWGRDELADGLITIAEFGAEKTLFDIEFSEQSPFIVDRSRVSGLRPDEDLSLEDLLIDRDQRLAAAIATVSNVYLPVVIDAGRDEGVRLPIASIADAAAGLGFANILIDPDGVTRRIDLVQTGGDQQYTQLALRFFGVTPESTELRVSDGGRRLVIREGESEGEWSIPLDRNGTMRIPWRDATLDETFRHVSWATIREYRDAIDDLTYNLRLMDQAGFISPERSNVIATANAAEQILAEAVSTRNSGQLFEYRELRRAFVALAGGFLSGGAENEIRAGLADFLRDDTPPEIRSEVDAILDDATRAFTTTREIYGEVIRLRRFLEEALTGKDVLVGYTATSTTDLGVTPFDEAFVNIGVHAVVLDALYSERFVQHLPVLPVVAAAFAISLVVGFLLTRLSSGPALITAFAAVVAVPILSAVVFAFSRWYLPVLHGSVPVFFVANAVLGVRFIQTSREKSVIRNTFEHYLAPEVISQLLENPSRITVGGKSEALTVLFTDIESFSRVAEQLEPERLVELLNEYLTDMTEVIVAQRGTIDKFEGDAIMSFFGAPIPQDDHPVRAATAAIQMKKLERLLNDRLIKGNLSPAPLITRIGINTGPMIVGNLGTNARLNYTVMGTAVNLAARLESANKLYGTHICVSHWTRDALDERFLLRRLDRVRVQGIDEAVRLYELIGYSGESTAPLREALELFENGIVDFEAREWERAAAHFRTVLRIYPNDGPAARFAGIADRYLTDPPRESWDGVITLEQK